jgi:hypothetical protein
LARLLARADIAVCNAALLQLLHPPIPFSFTPTMYVYSDQNTKTNGHSSKREYQTQLPNNKRLLGVFNQSHNSKRIEICNDHVKFEGDKYESTWIEDHAFYFWWGESYWYYIRNGEGYEVVKYHKNDGYHTLKPNRTDGKFRASGYVSSLSLSLLILLLASPSHYPISLLTAHAYRWTINSSDGNKTELVNMTITLGDGILTGLGWYGAGTNYNDSLSSKYIFLFISLILCNFMITRWNGSFSYDNNSVEWSEIYGNQTEHPFIYSGERNGI